MALTDIAGLMAVRKLWNKGQIPNGQRPKGPFRPGGTNKLWNQGPGKPQGAGIQNRMKSIQIFNIPDKALEREAPGGLAVAWPDDVLLALQSRQGNSLDKQHNVGSLFNFLWLDF